MYTPNIMIATETTAAICGFLIYESVGGYTGSAKELDDAKTGAKSDFVPTSLAVRDFVEGNLDVPDESGSSITKTSATFVHGRQPKLYLDGDVDSTKEVSFAVDTAPTLDSKHLVTSGGVKSAIDTAFSNLVDGAPDALNTLNEISAALNDDANLYNTLQTQQQAIRDHADAEIARVEGDISTRTAHVDTELAARYTKTETDAHRASVQAATDARIAAVDARFSARVSSVDASLADRYTKAETDAHRASVQAATDARIAAVDTRHDARVASVDASLDDRYTKAEIDAFQASDTAALQDRYTKSESDNLRAIDLAAAATRAADVDSRINRLFNEDGSDFHSSNRVTATVRAGDELVTTGGVKQAIDDLVNGAPAALDTLKEIADSLANDADLAGTLTTSISNTNTALQAAADDRYTKAASDGRYLQLAQIADPNGGIVLNMVDGELNIPVNIVVKEISGLEKLIFSNGFELLAGAPAAHRN